MPSPLHLLVILGVLVGGPALARAQQPEADRVAESDEAAELEPERAAPAEQSAEPDLAPVDPDAAWAEAQRLTLPAFTARAEAARAQTALADAYFAGTERLDVAFPAIAAGPMARLGWLDAVLAEQTRHDLERARERGTFPPELGGDDRTESWLLARAGALAAEGEAAERLRRLVLGLRSLAAEHPRLAGDGYARDRDALGAELAVLDVQVRGLDEGADRDAKLSELRALQARAAALDALADRARRAATVSGAPSPLDRGDLGKLEMSGASSAADRLDRVQAVLAPAERREVNEALRDWLSTDAATADGRRDGWPVTTQHPDPDALRTQVLTLHRARAARLAELVAARTPLGVGGSSQAAADKASQRAQEARREATEAASRVTDESSRLLAELLERVAQAEADAEDAWSETRAREEAFVALESDWNDTLRRLEAQVQAVLALPAGLGSDRRGQARAAWADLHQQLTSLRRAAIKSTKSHNEAQGRSDDARALTLASRAELEANRVFVNGLPEGEARGNGLLALDAWEVALASREDAAARAMAAAEAERDATFATLRRDKSLRERLRPSLSSADRAPGETLFRDIELELRLFVPNVFALARRRLAAALELPLILTDLDRLVSVVISSFWVVLLLVAGLWLRGRVPAIVEPAVLRLGKQERRLFQRNFRPLVKPVTIVVVAALDLFLLSLVMAPVRERLPELAIVLVLVRIAVLFRLIDGAFRLGVAPRSEHRPALVAVDNDVWPLVSRAERLLLLWMLLGTLVQYIVRDVIGADALAWLVGRGFLFAFLGLGLFLLHLAEPHVRAAIARGGPDGRMKESLVRPPRFIARAPRAAVAGAWLLSLRTWQLVQGNVEEGTLFGRFLNVVNRRRLSQAEDDVVVPPLSAEVAEKLGGRVTAVSARVLYPKQIEEIDGAFEGWRNEQSRGLVLVVGDRGQGKRVLVPDWAQGVAELAGLELRSAQITNRILTERDLLRQLANLLSIPGVTDEESFRIALEELPPTLFVVQHIQQAFLRRVGGFRALHALFRTLTPSCSRHFWLLAVHAPAWRLLERIGTVVNAHTFRAIVELPRIGGTDLQTFLMGRAEQQGLTVDFGPLSSATAAGQPAAERERTAEAFFRLLAEAAGGNPRVAVSLWLRSLYPGATEEDIKVRLPDAISNPKLPPLTDPALLILAAVRVHGGLTLREIGEVNNMEPGLVQTTVQVLENLALLDREAETYHIDIAVLAAVTALLRRRHFVYGKDVA